MICIFQDLVQVIIIINMKILMLAVTYLTMIIYGKKWNKPNLHIILYNTNE